jgi:hypothetical protein
LVWDIIYSAAANVCTMKVVSVLELLAEGSTYINFSNS